MFIISPGQLPLFALYPLHKTCKKCGTDKPISDFPWQFASKDLHRSACRTCLAADKRYYLAHRHDAKPAYVVPHEKRCPGCSTVKPLAAFGLSRTYRDGRQVYCRACRASRHANTVWPRRRAPISKRCRTCGQTKGAAHFSPVRPNPDGLCNQCKTCKAACTDRYGLRNRRAHQSGQPPAVPPPLRLCHTCQTEQPLAEFWRRSRNRDGYAWECKVCFTARRAARISRREVAALYAGQDGQCAYCARPLGRHYHLEHMVPRSRGGASHVSNICLACPPCNYDKGTKTAAEYRAALALRPPTG